MKRFIRANSGVLFDSQGSRCRFERRQEILYQIPADDATGSSWKRPRRLPRIFSGRPGGEPIGAARRIIGPLRARTQPGRSPISAGKPASFAPMRPHARECAIFYRRMPEQSGPRPPGGGGAATSRAPGPGEEKIRSETFTAFPGRLSRTGPAPTRCLPSREPLTPPASPAAPPGPRSAGRPPSPESPHKNGHRPQ